MIAKSRKWTKLSFRLFAATIIIAGLITGFRKLINGNTFDSWAIGGMFVIIGITSQGMLDFDDTEQADSSDNEIDESFQLKRKVDDNLVRYINLVEQMNDNLVRYTNAINQMNSAVTLCDDSVYRMTNAIKRSNRAIHRIDNILVRCSESINEMNLTIARCNSSVDQMNQISIAQATEQVNQLFAPIEERIHQFNEAFSRGKIPHETQRSEVESPVEPLDENPPLRIPSVSDTCQNCRNFHGESYGGVMLVCGCHPYGAEDSSCRDFEALS